MLVDRDCHIVYTCGDVDRYLTHRPGVPSDDLLDKARHDLRSILRTAIRTALSEHRAVSVTGRLQRDSQYESVLMSAHVIQDRQSEEELVLIRFEQESGQPRERDTAANLRNSHLAQREYAANVPPDETAEPSLAPPGGAEEADFDQQAIVRQLEDELAAMKEDLQTTLEQLATTNEEFKTTHEELLSMNEELQSTNEELETSKEELQSLNEELSTVNNQLGIKVEELEKKHADLENLLAATDVATICLDADLTVRWFTPAGRRSFA